MNAPFLPPMGANATAPKSWVETYQEQLQQALAFLRKRGLAITRLGGERELVGRYHVSGFTGEFSNSHIVELAQQYGFEG